METQNKLSRRSFMQGAAVAVAGVAALGAAGCASTGGSGSASNSNVAVGLPESWDYEAEVVVVGYGGAGSIAAITAADQGASVILIEKYPDDTETEIRHCPSSRAAGAALLACWNAEEGSKAVDAHSIGLTPKDVCDAWGERASKHLDYVRSLGYEYSHPVNPAESGGRPSNGEYPMIYGGNSTVLSGGVMAGNGSGFMQVSRTNVRNRAESITVLWETNAQRLIRNEETKEICGVVCLTADGSEINVKAQKAVALTTGGYGQNEEMKKNFLRGYPAHFYSCTNHQGDGIRMGQAVGADLVHMMNGQGAGITYHPDWGRGASFSSRNESIYVDKRGNRFFYEMNGPSHGVWFEFCRIDPKTGDYPAAPSWRIFGSDARWPLIATREKGFLDGTDTSQDWTPTTEEIGDKDLMVSKGWCQTADTIEAMCETILEDPENEGKMVLDNLKASLENYNRYVVEGADPDFNRPAASLAPVNPPYFWHKNYPGGAATQGGLKRNGKGQVIDAFGEPIPRLYVAGENGNVWACFYPRAGSNTSDNVAFGWIIGEEMAALEPWDAA